MTLAVAVVCGVMLFIGAASALSRVVRGPSTLDRIVSLDILVATIFGVVAIEEGWSQQTYTLPILVVLAMVGFVGSVSIARFASVEPDAQKVIQRQGVERAAAGGDAVGDESGADAGASPADTGGAAWDEERGAR